MTLDVETSIHNKGSPFDPRNQLVTIHTKVDDAPTVCKWFDEPDFISDTRAKIQSCSMYVGVNCKFDLHWLRSKGLQLGRGVRVWDCMVAEFLLSGQSNPFASLNQLAERYGLGKKHDLVAEYWEKGVSTENIPRDVVEEYGNHDVDLSYRVYLAQLADPRLTPALHRLIILEGLDLLVLADLEWNGFLFDVAGATRRAEELTTEVKKLEEEIYTYAGGEPFNIDGDCLSYFLFGGNHSEELFSPVELVYKSGPKKGQTYLRNKHVGTKYRPFPGWFKPLPKTELSRSSETNKLYSTAHNILVQLKATSKRQKRIIECLLRRAELSKLIGTYLRGIPELMDEQGWHDGYIHGSFNQVVARTGRLSSSKPNMQNAPEDVDEFFISRF